MNAQPTIHLDSVILRKLTPDDANDIFEAFSDIEAMKFRRLPAMKTTEEALELIEKSEIYFKNETAIRWAVQDIESKTVIGTFLWNFKNGKQQSELGYSLHRNWWNKGIMEEIFHHMLDDYLWEHGVDILSAKVHKENSISIEVLEKLGFERHSTEERFYCYRKFRPKG